MPLDPELAAVLDFLAGQGTPMTMVHDNPAASRETFRAMTVGLRDPATLAAVASVDDAHIDGPSGPLAVRIYRPQVAGVVPTVVFFHGGGFVIGDLDTHDDHARLLCAEVGAVVVSVDYRLAPEHPFPAALEDCLAATRWAAATMADLGGDPARIGVAGDSAGAALAASVTLSVREGGPALAAQLLLYPTTDLRPDDSVHPSRVDNARGYFLSVEDMLWFSEQYVPEEGRRADPQASVLLAPDHAGLPPAVVVTAEYDPLRDEGEAYARALQEAGVTVVLRRGEGLVHGFVGMVGLSRAADAITREVLAAFKRLLG